jgi:SPX domain protein involved in polyphosphate accumulation
LENLLQRSRFELKYIIQEPTAHEVRQFARNHLMPDPFASAARGYSYDIYSVYLDNHGRSLMNQTLEGLRNRFKLRVRFYDDKPEHPVFFEVKRRVNDAIVKVRAKVRREAAHRLMYARDAWPDHTDLANPADERSYSALIKFCELRDKLGARPEVLVCYNREAWCSPEDDSIRVTFDRALEAAPYHAERTFRLLRDETWVRPEMVVPGIVLELKFTDRFPNWMRQMVQTFNLFRTSMAKYVTCCAAMTPDGRGMIRQNEAVKRMAAAQRWEQQRRAERDASAEPMPAATAATPPQTLSPVPAAGRVAL